MPSVGDHIRRNTRVLLISWAVGQVLQTVRLPILLTYLGLESFALWQLAFQLIGYLAFYNIGFDNAYLKYTAEYHARKDYKGLSQLLSTGVTIGFIVGAAIYGVIYFFIDDIVRTMMNIDTTAEQLADFRYLILVVAAVNWFKMVMGVNRAMLSGVQRLDIGSWIGVCMGPLELAAMAAGLHMGYGVKMLVTVFAIFNTANHFIMMYWNRKFLPEVRISPFNAKRRYIRPLFSLGGRMQAVGFIGIFINSIDMLIYNKYYGLGFTGSYATAQRLCERAASIARQSLGSLTSASADLHGRRDFEKMSQIYASASRVAMLISVFVFSFAFANADNLTIVFMGNEATKIAIATLQLFCIAKVLHTITSTGSSMLRGGGQAWQEFGYLLLTAVLFLVFFAFTQVGRVYIPQSWHLPSYTLSAKLATVGVPMALDLHTWSLLLAFPIALGVSSVIFIVISNIYFRAPLACPFDLTLLPSATTILAAFAIRWLWDAIPPSFFELILRHPWDGSRIDCFIGILVQGSVFAAVFGAMTLYMPGLSRKEKEQLIRFLPLGKNIAPRILPTVKKKPAQ